MHLDIYGIKYKNERVFYPNEINININNKRRQKSFIPNENNVRLNYNQNYNSQRNIRKYYRPEYEELFNQRSYNFYRYKGEQKFMPIGVDLNNRIYIKDQLNQKEFKFNQMGNIIENQRYQNNLNNYQKDIRRSYNYPIDIRHSNAQTRLEKSLSSCFISSGDEIIKNKRFNNDNLLNQENKNEPKKIINNKLNIRIQKNNNLSKGLSYDKIRFCDSDRNRFNNLVDLYSIGGPKFKRVDNYGAICRNKFNYDGADRNKFNNKVNNYSGIQVDSLDKDDKYLIQKSVKRDMNYDRFHEKKPKYKGDG